MTGAMAMSILAAILLAVALQSGGSADNSPGNDDIPKIVLAKGTPAQVEAYVSSQFAEFDKDRSGYIEEEEGPRSIQLCCADGPRDKLTGTAAWRHFLAENADDGDNRVSYAEFHDARYGQLLRNGIPVKREKLVVTGERPSPYGERQSGDGKVRGFLADMEFVKASPERVRAYVRQMFETMDKDGSHFIELAEAPAMLGMPKGKMSPDGTVTYDRNDPLTQLTGDEARAEYIRNVDKDGDGRVSFEEYAKPVMPQYLQRGIPLIPADWTAAKTGARKGG
jgi:Ca2+-binding EF-hand superfamily protein